MTREPIAPEDCPDPGWHKTHRYCPACTWTDEEYHAAQRLEKLDAARDLLVAAGYLVHKPGDPAAPATPDDRESLLQRRDALVEKIAGPREGATHPIQCSRCGAWSDVPCWCRPTVLDFGSDDDDFVRLASWAESVGLDGEDWDHPREVVDWIIDHCWGSAQAVPAPTVSDEMVERSPGEIVDAWFDQVYRTVPDDHLTEVLAEHRRLTAALAAPTEEES